MLHLLYLVAFTILAVLAISNLIRNLITLSMDSQRRYPPGGMSPAGLGRSPFSASSRLGSVPHPELLDDTGNVINEPLLVMRSINVEDAREQLDALYKSSPGKSEETEEDA
ncbi:MAG TPA: DUF2973 domain-containing protein [Candidatus Obscuribacterales bacterium]